MSTNVVVGIPNHCLHKTELLIQKAITAIYIPYILAELLSNLILKKVGPRILLPTLCTMWGLITVVQSKVARFRRICCLPFLPRTV